MTRIFSYWMFGVGVLQMMVGCALRTELPKDSVTLLGRVNRPHSRTAAQIKTDFAADAQTIKYTA